jgi:ribosomal protein S18 acetylase RimI-like enzyme
LVAEIPHSLRKGFPDDLDAAAHLLSSVRRASYPAIPPSIHDDDVELSPYLGSLYDNGAELVLAEVGGSLIGVAVVQGPVIVQLAVAQDFQGRGIGKQLVEAVVEQSPEQVTLWTFQSNARAQSFYAISALSRLLEPTGTMKKANPTCVFSRRSRTESLGEGKRAVSCK